MRNFLLKVKKGLEENEGLRQYARIDARALFLLIEDYEDIMQKTRANALLENKNRVDPYSLLEEAVAFFFYESGRDISTAFFYVARVLQLLEETEAKTRLAKHQLVDESFSLRNLRMQHLIDQLDPWARAGLAEGAKPEVAGLYKQVIRLANKETPVKAVKCKIEITNPGLDFSGE